MSTCTIIILFSPSPLHPSLPLSLPPSPSLYRLRCLPRPLLASETKQLPSPTWEGEGSPLPPGPARRRYQRPTRGTRPSPAVPSHGPWLMPRQERPHSPIPIPLLRGQFFMYMYNHVHVRICTYTCILGYQSILNHNSLGCERPSGLDVKQSPNAQDVFWPIPGLISCAGVTGSVGIQLHLYVYVQLMCMNSTRIDVHVHVLLKYCYPPSSSCLSSIALSFLFLSLLPSSLPPSRGLRECYRHPQDGHNSHQTVSHCRL